MKNTKFSKITLLVLTLALVFGSIVPMTVSAETTETTKPTITQQNVSYQGDFALMFAVDASTVTPPVKLYRFDTEPTSETVGTLVSTSDKLVAADADKNNLKVDSYVLKTTGVAASKMTTYSYFQVEDATGAKSDVVRYSVAEYLYERLASGEASDTQTALYNKVIEFGDAAQAHFTPDATSIAKYRYVTVDGGYIDGYTAGVYPIGKSLIPIASGTEIVSKWTVITYDVNGNPTTATVNGGTAFTVADSIKNEVSAGLVVAYRAGTHNFDKYSTKDTVSSFMAVRNSSTVEFATDASHKTVVKYNFPGTTSAVDLKIANKDVSAADATAFEFSFDFKMDYSEITDRHASPYFEIKPQVNGNSTAFGRWFFYTGNGAAGTATHNQIYTTSGNKVKIEDSDSTQWNHFRLVIYKADITKAYVYINGDTTNPMIFDCDANVLTADTFAKIERCVIQATSRTQNSIMYIDNVYSGFIKE